MASVREGIGAELQALVQEGAKLLEPLAKKKQIEFLTGYHRWYTRALAVVGNLIPDREAEFRRLYDRDARRKRLDAETYTLEDYVQGLAPARSYPWEDSPLDVDNAASTKFINQLEILRSAESRLSDILANIRGVLQADLFDSELDAARHLKDNGHLRAAGAVAGVVLESHLAEVCSQRSVTVPRKAPHISDYNEALKGAGVLDVVQWRGLQRLADIRNLCDHKRDRDPTQDEVDELISGVDKAIKTLA